MIDERGRGGDIDPSVEYVCELRLMQAIWEQAIIDKTFLDELNADKMPQYGEWLYRSEIEAFYKSPWARFMLDHLDVATININDAMAKGVKKAALSKGQTLKVRRLPYDGKSHTVEEWAKIYKTTEGAILRRWYDHRGRSNPHWLDGFRDGKSRRWEYEGEMLSYYEIAKRARLTAGEVQGRLNRGITAYEAVEQARESRRRYGLPIYTDNFRSNKRSKKQ